MNRQKKKKGKKEEEYRKKKRKVREFNSAAHKLKTIDRKNGTEHPTETRGFYNLKLYQRIYNV